MASNNRPNIYDSFVQDLQRAQRERNRAAGIEEDEPYVRPPDQANAAYSLINDDLPGQMEDIPIINGSRIG